MFRFILWSKKTDGAKISAKPPALKSLPPTTQALEMNLRRAHYQAALWSNCVSGVMPTLNPCDVRI